MFSCSVSQVACRTFRFHDFIIDAMNAEDDLTFNDTLVALRLMRAQFPKIQKHCERQNASRSRSREYVVKRMEDEKKRDMKFLGGLKHMFIIQSWNLALDITSFALFCH
ncbi:hypothetical protein L6164_034399 [Bauhinia variegata]|uniref:Uncharacterized protein n=1 Tax=Bauhinia variegata TaxID=167791 RepID=A0ACB9KV32_BAUVA|nr:hypothetical protein L6164_034399 [Bauhinia variegata]